MSEEADKELERAEKAEAEKAEKKRLLSELAAKGDFKKANKTYSQIEVTPELSELYRQSVKLPDAADEVTLLEEPLTDAPARPITKITHHEIKAMRAVTSTEPEPVQIAQHKVNNFIIRGWDSFIAAMKPKRIDCSSSGHECVHCGATYKGATIAPEKQKVATAK